MFMTTSSKCFIFTMYIMYNFELTIDFAKADAERVTKTTMTSVLTMLTRSRYWTLITGHNTTNTNATAHTP